MTPEPEVGLASPCHGPGEVANLHGSVWICLNGLGDDDRICGALYEVAPDGTAGVLSVTSTDAVRNAELQAQLADAANWSVADIDHARDYDGGWWVDCVEVDMGSDGMKFGFGGIPAQAYCAAAGHLPQQGDRIRVYGRFGQPVRGIDVLLPKAEGDPPEAVDEWANVYFKTDAELHQEWAASVQGMRDSREEEFESGQEEMDAAYEALPVIFRRRVDGYRERGGREWRMGFEKYEVFCLSEAAKIAAHVKPTFDLLMEVDRVLTGKGDDPRREEQRSDLLAAARDFWPDAEPEEIERGCRSDPALIAAQIAVGRWAGLPHEEQAEVLDDGHSGNTFGASCQFAVLLAAYDGGHDDAADWIVGHHGALAPLVGSKQYRDLAVEGGDAEPAS